MVVIPPGDPHRALLRPIGAHGNAIHQTLFFEGAVVAVTIKEVGAGVVGDVEVRPAIIVVVSPGSTEAVIVMGIVYPGFLGDFFKGAVAAIVKEQIGLALHAPGTALHENAVITAKFLVTTKFRQFVHVNMNVARNEQVDFAIAIIVGPGCAGAETSGSHPGLLGHVFEFAVSAIAVKG